jgi:hypothetical protein
MNCCASPKCDASRKLRPVEKSQGLNGQERFHPKPAHATGNYENTGRLHFGEGQAQNTGADQTISPCGLLRKRPKFPSCVIESVEQVSTYF